MRATLLLALLFLWLVEPARSQGIQEAQKSIAKLTCVRNGRDKPHHASGFLWPRAAHVVAALHTVADCKSIVVALHTENGDFRSEARVTRVLATDDLALLELTRPPPEGIVPLTIANADPGVNQEITAIGYPLNATEAVDNTLRTRKLKAVCQLDACVPPEVMKEINKLPVLNGMTQVVNLQGTILPGHSGGPLFDNRAQVVAVANGGVNRGASAWSWAIPATRLAALERSQEQLIPKWPKEADVLFSADLGGNIQNNQLNQVAAIETNLGHFKIADAVSFDEIIVQARLSKDPFSLDHLIRVLRARNPQVVTSPFLAGLKFDIFRHVQTGGTFVLPRGAKVQKPIATAQGLDIAKGALGDITLAYFATTIQPGQPALIDFERTLIAQANGVVWQLDPERSNRLGPQGLPIPYVRPPFAPGDTPTSVFRKSHRGFTNGVPSAYISVTAAAKGASMIGAAAYVMQPAQRPTVAFYERWYGALIAANLTRLP